MKKWILLVGLGIVMSLCACGQNAENTTTTEKKAHEHTWIEATCTVPKTCKECGATEGTAKGHTTSIGICSDCGQAQGKDIVDKINKKIDEAYELESEAVQMMQDGVNNLSFDTYKMSLDLFTDAKECYSVAFETCGNYEEPSYVKQKLKEAIDSVPTEILGFDNESNRIYGEAAKNFIAAGTEAQLAGIKLDDLY